MAKENLAEKFMELVKGNIQRMGPEIGAMVDHQVGRGATELANAIFGGQAFVLYGHGNTHPANVNQLDQAKEQSPDMHHTDGQEQHRSRSM
jgi:hypothetical protein